jgi:hypothetical protein
MVWATLLLLYLSCCIYFVIWQKMLRILMKLQTTNLAVGRDDGGIVL